MDPILAAPITAGLISAYDAYYRMSLADMLDLCEIVQTRNENERRAYDKQQEDSPVGKQPRGR